MTRPPEDGEGWALAHVRAVARSLLRIPRAFASLPILAWMGIIWTLSANRLPGIGGGGTGMSLLTNFAHAPEFGLLALWLILVVPRRDGWAALTGKTAAVILACVTAYALVDEMHQSRVPGRDASLLDVVTDCVGAACVLWIARYAGGRAATHRGLVARFLFGLTLCALAALGSTLWGLTHDTGLWL
jgi:hypothetical protein